MTDLATRVVAVALLASCTPVLDDSATSTIHDDILNGTPASAATEPWAAFISFTMQNGDSNLCSGALVSPTKVLTAAHCMVCTASAQVTMLGGGTIAMASRAVDPTAYPVAVDCNLSASLPQEINDKTNIGADLAVITLASPSSVTPLDVLIEPPFGWNPAVTTPGISGVTIVGRGPANDVNGSDLSVMRKGHASLDALSQTPHDGCTPAPATNLPFLQLWNSGSEATIGHGDSGGPMVGTFFGTQKVIGVASWLCGADTAYFPPTFAAENAPWLAQQLGKPNPGGDSDHDHVLDVADNCPDASNSAQQDGDNDNVGDACDNCPADKNGNQDNCNAEAETATGAPHRGDACDPTPCATVEMTWDTAPASYVPSPVLPCYANGYGFATCSYEMPTGFAITPVGRTNEKPVPADVGLRHCQCTGPHDTPAQRKANCSADCKIDYHAYTGDPEWRQLSVSGTGGDPLTAITIAPSPNPIVNIAWDSIKDLGLLGTAPLPPPPWTPDGDGIVNNDHLDGIVWAHVVDKNGAPTSSSLASSYAPADHRFREVFHWHKIPQYAPAWPWTYCASCQFEAPWVTIADPERFIVMGVNQRGGYDVSKQFTPPIVTLMSKGTVVPAAEPERHLQLAGVTQRAVVIDAQGAVIGALHQTAQGVVAESLRGTALRGSDSVRLFAYSGLHRESFAVRLAAGATQAHVDRFTASNGWESLALTGDALGIPMAATVRGHEHALYVIDRVGVSTRLVRIDLLANRVVVQVPRLLSKQARAVSLSVGKRGELLLAVDVGAGTELAWIEDGATMAPRLAGRASYRPSLGGDVRELASGVHLAVPDGDYLAPGFVPASARRAPTADEGLSPLL